MNKPVAVFNVSGPYSVAVGDTLLRMAEDFSDRSFVSNEVVHELLDFDYVDRMEFEWMAQTNARDISEAICASIQGAIIRETETLIQVTVFFNANNLYKTWNEIVAVNVQSSDKEIGK